MAVLRAIYHWIYCLPIQDVLLLLLAAVWIFRVLACRWHNRIWWCPSLIVLGFLWGLAVLYATVLNRVADTISGGSTILFHSYFKVLAGGNPELLRSNFMNVLLFFPGGLILGTLLPYHWPRWIRSIVIVTILGGFSIGIEHFQLIHELGSAEIDDVFHNMLGALLGCMALPQEYHFSQQEGRKRHP